MPLSTLITQPISYSLPFQIYKSIIDYTIRGKTIIIQIDAAIKRHYIVV